VDQLDIRVFLRVPNDVLQRRRHERHGYHTAGELSTFSLSLIHSQCPRSSSRPHVPPSPSPHLTSQVQSDPEGTLWRDPPHYWEQIVYPAYVRAHQALFEGGDVEQGAPTRKVERLMLFEGNTVGMQEILNRVMETVVQFTEDPKRRG